MSRPSLLRPRGEPRHSRRRSRRRAAASGDPTIRRGAAHGACDPDVQRVREAGGPLDRASYACACGYLFDASVSTSVVCPHCGADQAW
ncbi:MAG TPA: hypothetical protein VMF09_08825 [Solirubrobacteraceae bacterium]|nr:hypothetical protein [Solirubrobacteraceae bacterium]